VFDSAFRFLFKYPLLVFQQGDFTWGVSRAAMLAILAATALAVVSLLTYRGTGQGTEKPARDRAVLLTLRAALLLVILFCLFRPTLILKASVPQQNFVGVLLDDSRSMTIADTNGQPRTLFVQQQLSDPKAKLLNDLSSKFVLRFFSFSSSADRVASPAALHYAGTSTRLGQALERARDELSGLPLAGLVLVTDGADTSDASLDEPLASLKARQIPVFPVGLGQERFSKDIQVTRVETPASVLKGTSLVVNVVLTQTGYAGQNVALTVEDSGHIVSTQDVTMPADGESSTVRVHFMANDAGARVFKFAIAPQAGEQVTENNARDALIEVKDRVEKVLYYEGEPRAEYKFIRRAVEDDKNLQVVGLNRTAENKYFRQGVSNPDELVGGFPKTREELFAYRAIILGSVEAAAFTPEQQRMLADFVNKRGGGLLMLGGRRSFAEGGWAGTPLGDILPVVIDGGKQPSYMSELSVRPTRQGGLFPVTQLADTEDASAAKWDSMPAVSTVNPIKDVKPGATILLAGADNRRQQQVVLAYQRYGRGKTIAFPVQDSFLWYMDAKVPVKDMTYATFWRRMVRWLVDGVPEQVNITTSRDRYEPGETVRLTSEVLDTAYTEINDAHVEAKLTAPSGKITDLPLEWTVEHDGQYGATFGADEPGLYEIKVTATRDGKDIGSNVAHIRVSAGDAEYFDANMRAPLLKRIAEETEGRFFTPANASSLPEAISYSGRGVTVVEERDLWDMPILLILALALMGAEWGYRRSRGLA